MNVNGRNHEKLSQKKKGANKRPKHIGSTRQTYKTEATATKQTKNRFDELMDEFNRTKESQETMED